MPSRPYGNNKSGRGKRDTRRDERRRTNDDEETVLDSHEVSSVDRGMLEVKESKSIYL